MDLVGSLTTVQVSSKIGVKKGEKANTLIPQKSEVLRYGELQTDTPTGKTHTLYSLRYTAICIRIIDIGGKVNIFNLAKNAGTSSDQIERFYARFLPFSREMAKNLQIFGE